LIDFIPILLKKLHLLYIEIEKMVGYRFYGASLLLVYDALNVNNLKMNIIDFTHCITRKEMEDNQHIMSYPPERGANYPDHGFLKGLHTLIEILQDIYNDQKNQ
jgi:inositol-hexakisphosphate kinase